MDGLIDAAGAAGATLVYADNLDAYCPVDRPMTEEMPPAATTRDVSRHATRLRE